MAWTKDKKWGLSQNAKEPDYVKSLNEFVDTLPIEKMIAGGPKSVGTDDLVLSIKHEIGTPEKPTVNVGSRLAFLEAYSGELNPTWAQCHPSDPSLNDPIGSKGIWVAFLDSNDKPVYLSRTVTLNPLVAPSRKLKSAIPKGAKKSKKRKRN